MISFKGRHFPKEVILMSVRWYVAYSLSYRDIEEMLAERGVSSDHATVNRWVIEYAPKLEEQFRKSDKKRVGTSWRMDETYIKCQGEWNYLYRAVDKEGKTIDFMLSKSRDTKAARSFFAKAIGSSGLPKKVTIDKSGANTAGLIAINLQLALFAGILLSLFACNEVLKLKIHVRQIKYLNNIVEQDHRGIKKITKPMMGFKAFYSAEATLSGIELHRMLRKEQHINSDKKTIFEQFNNLAG
jgi:putative transposase